MAAEHVVHHLDAGLRSTTALLVLVSEVEGDETRVIALQEEDDDDGG